MICNQLNDPFLGFLIARLTEAKLGPTARKGGLILGPCARNILSIYFIPELKKMIEGGVLGVNRNANSGSGLAQRGMDAVMLGLVCSMWLQDTTLTHELLSLAVQRGIFRYAMPVPGLIGPLISEFDSNSPFSSSNSVISGSGRKYNNNIYKIYKQHLQNLQNLQNWTFDILLSQSQCNSSFPFLFLSSSRFFSALHFYCYFPCTSYAVDTFLLFYSFPLLPLHRRTNERTDKNAEIGCVSRTHCG